MGDFEDVLRFLRGGDGARGRGGGGGGEVAEGGGEAGEDAGEAGGVLWGGGGGVRIGLELRRGGDELSWGEGGAGDKYVYVVWIALEG